VQWLIARIGNAVPDGWGYVGEIILRQGMGIVAVVEESAALADELEFFLAGILGGLARAVGVDGEFAEADNAFR
jgi:hypothetical protein